MCEKNILFVSFSNHLSSAVSKVVEGAAVSVVPHVIVTQDTVLNFKYAKRFDYRKCSLGMMPDEDYDYPVDANLLDEMKKYESSCLKMMDRFESTNGLFSYQARVNLYHKIIAFWYNYIKKNDIKACFFTLVPHVVFDYVIYALCKTLNIKTHMFYRLNVVVGRNVSLYGIEEIGEGIKNIKETYNSVDLNSNIPLDSRFNSYLEIRDNPGQTFTGKKNYSRKKNIITRALSSLNYRVRNEIHWINHGKSLSDSISKFLIKRKYLKNECKLRAILNIEELKDKKFVYIPLHFQPECSTNPLGGDFVHQDLMVDMIAKNIPPDWLVVVKKHVKHNSKDYTFNRLDLSKNVVVADNKINSLDLVKASTAVATVTGTAGFEGFLNYKPVLLFGNTFYMDAPNVFKIRSNDHVKSCIKQIAKGIDPPSLQQVKAFLYACQLNSYSGWVDNRYRPISQLTDEENTTTLSHIMLEKFNEWIEYE
ncbi:hypothetical protein BZG04_15870, partial [Salinivibrio kushneri]|uniref:capsular polysaccharide export protein, LipB/KpsS family n=1 Tax=Salinivibrio kushneri TaxID=1908198 RepID=UPI00098970BE